MAVTTANVLCREAPWREHYPSNVPTHLGYPAQAAWCLLERAAEESPDRIACWHLDESWTYAYFELAERGEVVDRESGESTRFEGFLGAQATQLFEMTRKT